MGAMIWRRIEMVATLSEQVGYKAGIALSRAQMGGFLGDQGAEFIEGPDDAAIRVRSEEYDACLCHLLYCVGNIRSPSNMLSITHLYHEVKQDKALLPVYLTVAQQLPRFLSSALNLREKHSDDRRELPGSSKQAASPIQGAVSIAMAVALCEAEMITKRKGTIDPKPFVQWARRECGSKGARMALAMVQGVDEDLHKSSLSDFRRFEWSDLADLEDLYRSENLQTVHGQFFDQRFIDFLCQNFDSIDQINWRKFEGLTCEFFHRLGLDVAIGEGRNDNNVDARIWRKAQQRSASPLILVQCKRESTKVGKIVVKALHADVAYEKAELGFIVTTSALSPGARKICSTRRYPLVEANRATLKKWVTAMRTPFAGVFLGE